MNTLSRVGLGTAQFGHDYGISNRHGQPSELEIAKILTRAAASGIAYLDTAFDYGQAEAIIGRHWPADHKFRIVTKLPGIRAETINSNHVEAVLDGLATSLDRLKQSQVHAVLVHNVADLAKPGWQHLVAALQEAKLRGWAARIGASIYDNAQLALVESRLRPELVQAPINVLDRRIVASGALDRLKQQGVEVHARSVFLQGLLLIDPADLTGFFAPMRAHVASLRQRCQAAGLSVLAGCLAYVLGLRAIDAVIVGINSAMELEDIETAVAAIDGIDFGPSAALDGPCIDPRCWPPRGH